jgi:hypothetical protein
MRRLLAGHESAERFDLLLSLTSIRSEGIQAAVRDHLVNGHAVASAAALNGELDKNVRRAIATLEQAADIVEKIKEIDWAKHSVK